LISPCYGRELSGITSTGIRIVVNDKDGQLIQVNEFTIKADYPSNYRDLKHKLLLKEKVIKESASLKELWEIATNV
jgi:hypothetical protein